VQQWRALVAGRETDLSSELSGRLAAVLGAGRLAWFSSLSLSDSSFVSAGLVAASHYACPVASSPWMILDRESRIGSRMLWTLAQGVGSELCRGVPSQSVLVGSDGCLRSARISESLSLEGQDALM
jgi:hypothetical protein